jgi:hypothetical protein
VIVRIITLVLCCVVISTSAENPLPLKSHEVWICTRWAWNSQNALNKQVVCLTWKKQDCSKRLHKEICMAEGRTS